MRPLSTEASSVASGPVTKASGLYAPFNPEFQKDSDALLAKVRNSEPIFFSPELGSWVVTRHDTIKSILRNTKQFSSRIVSDPLVPMCPHARNVFKESSFDVPPLLVNNDPPTHSMYRKFFSEPLQRERILALEPYIRRAVDEKIDNMQECERPLDLVKALTWETPALVLLHALGVPQDDVPLVKRWADSRVVLQWGKPSEEEQIRMATGSVEFFDYASRLVHSKINLPGDDIVSDLLRQRAGDDSRMTIREIVGAVFNFLFAGHETTSSSAALMFNTLLRNRDLWTAVASGSQSYEAVVDESLRITTPILSTRRIVTEPVDVLGFRLSAGDRVVLLFGSANHDDAVFEQPDEFLPGRKNIIQHLTFGMGIHYCLGAPLARLQLAVMLERVSSRLPSMTVIQDQELNYIPNTSVRALKELMVTW